MNERMIELYQEAGEFAYKICREQGRKGGTSDHIWNVLSIGKFAELIVRECATFIDSHEPIDKYGEAQDTVYGKDLLQHFGVEE